MTPRHADDADSVIAVIPGPPHGQGRGRACRTQSGVRVVDPRGSRDWKGYAQIHMAHAMRGREPFREAVSVSILAVFPCPRSQHRKHKPRPRRWQTGKPDIDNVTKAVLDAGNGVLWLDDSQVASLRVTTLVGAQDEPARVEIEALACGQPETASVL